MVMLLVWCVLVRLNCMCRLLDLVVIVLLLCGVSWKFGWKCVLMFSCRDVFGVLVSVLCSIFIVVGVMVMCGGVWFGVVRLSMLFSLLLLVICRMMLLLLISLLLMYSCGMVG